MVIVILTHGMFGEELLHAAEMIIGRQDKVEVISIQGGVSMNDASLKLEEILKQYNKESCLVFTDMFGGSPSNISMAYLDKDSVELVSGVNLPMLLKAFTMRMDDKNTLEHISKETADAGRNSIKVAGELLNSK